MSAAVSFFNQPIWRSKKRPPIYAVKRGEKSSSNSKSSYKTCPTKREADSLPRTVKAILLARNHCPFRGLVLGGKPPLTRAVRIKKACQVD